MTTNQTIDGVPRELAERFAQYAESGKVAEPGMVEELRALLDAPKCSACNGTGRMHEPGCEPGACTACFEKTAALPQGEPVAYRYKEGHASWENENPWVPTTLGHGEVLLGRKELAANGTFKGEERDHYLALVVEPLYAEQPAPVAVVLPERREEVGTGGATYYIPVGWNACIDELKRLNTARPAHANTPPGTEPCGTHHDNDGLDEWRKPTCCGSCPGGCTIGNKP